MKKNTIIGSGFSALAASSYLAKSGLMYTFMKNESVGGRARQFKIDGFDMGPSWYWMPDVLIVLLDFGKKLLIELIKLSPAYRVYFGVEVYRYCG
jgi:phytoene desaturase